jgi:hypothetical protein
MLLRYLPEVGSPEAAGMQYLFGCQVRKEIIEPLELKLA